LKKPHFYLSAFLLLTVSTAGYAHHSYYAIYDVENKVSIMGYLVRLEFRQPHIEIEVLVDGEDGEPALWFIESTSPQRWDRLVRDRQVADIGEVITVNGWPSRNGHAEMLLSSLDGDKGTIVVIDEVRQPRR